MPPGQGSGAVAAPRRSRFSRMLRAKNRFSRAMCSTTSARPLMSCVCRASAAADAMAFHRNALQKLRLLEQFLETWIVANQVPLPAFPQVAIGDTNVRVVDRAGRREQTLQKRQRGINLAHSRVNHGEKT